MLILEKSAFLRLSTVLLFYFSQGVPLGLFLYAIPAWLAANGASTTAVAGTVSMAILPWTLKFFVGFIMDRYTYLPMGRRRIWIIGAQATVVAVLLAGAALSPDASNIWLISMVGFLASAATAFQDVAIDGLAVDIMEEDERVKATGIMFGAQVIGLSATTYAGGQLMSAFGISAAYLVAAVAVGIVLSFGIVTREREGEGRFPWSGGKAHSRNVAIQVDAWAPLLVNSAKAMLAPLSLVALVIFFLRSTPMGVAEAYHPVLTATIGGWEQTGYTNTVAMAQLAVGIFALAFGGVIGAKLGAQRAGLIMFALVCFFALGFALLKDQWSNGALLTAYIWQTEFFNTMLAVALVPIAMRLCDPRVAATQFTLFMAASNVGRPIGNSIAASSEELGRPELMYFALAGIFALLTLILWRVSFPTSAPKLEEIIEAEQPLMAGEPVPKVN